MNYTCPFLPISLSEDVKPDLELVRSITSTFNVRLPTEVIVDFWREEFDRMSRFSK